MTAPPYMPLYIGDYLRDTEHFDAALSGAYLHLNMHAWTHDGKIPCDDRQLARIARLTPYRWKRSKTMLLALFIEAGENFYQKRVATELANALKRRVSKRNKSERGSVIHKVGESFLSGESARVAKIVPARNGNAAQAAPKQLSEQASEASEAQAELPIATPKQKIKIPVSDELKYLVSRPPRGPRKGGRAP